MPLTVRGPRTPDGATVNDHRIDGLTLRVWTLANASPDQPAEARRDVVLVHGLGASSASFEHLAQHLARSGTVHVLDLPGFAGLPRPGDRLEVEDLARLVTRWIERADLVRPTLVGHSMGAQVVTEVAASAPGVASGLVLVGPTTDAAGRSAPRQLLRLARSTVHDSAALQRVLLRSYLECGPRWYLTELRAMLRHHIEVRLPHVDVPVLVVRGARDSVAPDDWAQLLAGSVPQGRVVTVPGGGHAVMYDHASEVSDLVREHVG
ncbi:alpha/beta fold hydrolase [Cellulomonas xiejunii]|uniref:alpha/beta fold hydrolase n=1 Tax=Cellulomonas xiejunii TaxID=2968083 RepID=UPI001D0E7C4C|nr:alpha/beta hydrolase [Cellulomonas xiejunii]MCC2315093.1 alpha/beta hydrolase [Cellulomonas xiejunii]MCC2315702.1 alpha/beta hydrolase [Cellulomonas xiejunii]